MKGLMKGLGPSELSIVLEAGGTVTVGPPDVPAEDFRAALRRHACGVAVVTTGTDRPAGMCVTSLVSVSLSPPLVSFCVGPQSSTWPALRRADRVLVHLLADGQAGLAARFARPGADRFGPDTRWSRGPAGLPMLAGVLAWLLVVPCERIVLGDHRLVVGRVVETGQGPGERPLLHHDGAFTSLHPG